MEKIVNNRKLTREQFGATLPEGWEIKSWNMPGEGTTLHSSSVGDYPLVELVNGRVLLVAWLDGDLDMAIASYVYCADSDRYEQVDEQVGWNTLDADDDGLEVLATIARNIDLKTATLEAC